VGRDADVGVAQVSEPCTDVTSRSDVRALGVPFIKTVLALSVAYCFTSKANMYSLHIAIRSRLGQDYAYQGVSESD
jgi:hypothetical protein